MQFRGGTIGKRLGAMEGPEVGARRSKGVRASLQRDLKRTQKGLGTEPRGQTGEESKGSRRTFCLYRLLLPRLSFG